MANKAYNRGVSRERELVNALRAKGWIAARSAGSKSKVDVWAFHPELQVLQMFQLKTEKGGKNLYQVREAHYEEVVADVLTNYYCKGKRPRRKTKDASVFTDHKG